MQLAILAPNATLLNKDIESGFQSILLKIKTNLGKQTMCSDNFPLDFKDIKVKLSIPNTKEDITPINDLTLFEILGGLAILGIPVKATCINAEVYTLVEIVIGIEGNLILDSRQKAILTVQNKSAYEMEIFTLQSHQETNHFYRYEKHDITSGTKDFPVTTHAGMAIDKSDISKVTNITNFHANNSMIPYENAEIIAVSELVNRTVASYSDGKSLLGTADHYVMPFLAIQKTRIAVNSQMTFIIVNTKSL